MNKTNFNANTGVGAIVFVALCQMATMVVIAWIVTEAAIKIAGIIWD